MPQTSAWFRANEKQRRRFPTRQRECCRHRFAGQNVPLCRTLCKNQCWSCRLGCGVQGQNELRYGSSYIWCMLHGFRFGRFIEVTGGLTQQSPPPWPSHQLSEYHRMLQDLKPETEEVP